MAKTISVEPTSEIAKALEAKRKELAELEAKVPRAELVTNIQKNANLEDAKLYTVAKRFCNSYEKIQRLNKKNE